MKRIYDQCTGLGVVPCGTHKLTSVSHRSNYNERVRNGTVAFSGYFSRARFSRFRGRRPAPPRHFSPMARAPPFAFSGFQLQRVIGLLNFSRLADCRLVATAERQSSVSAQGRFVTYIRAYLWHGRRARFVLCAILGGEVDVRAKRGVYTSSSVRECLTFRRVTRCE